MGILKMNLRPNYHPLSAKLNMLIFAYFFYRVSACNAYRTRYGYGISVSLSVQCQYCVQTSVHIVKLFLLFW